MDNFNHLTNRAWLKDQNRAGESIPIYCRYCGSELDCGEDYENEICIYCKEELEGEE